LIDGGYEVVCFLANVGQVSMPSIPWKAMACV
jgi:hypothetical protein